MSDPVVERVAMVNLDVAADRAQRMLDGQTVNREQMCRDTLAMTRELRMWREKYADISGKAKPA